VAQFDLIIRGGTIHDGTGAPPRIGDVGIRGGRIVAVGQVEGDAAEVIDAAAKIVTPGASTGTTNSERPAASPACPAVRAAASR